VTRGRSDTWRRRVLNGNTLRLTHDITTTPLAGGLFFEKPFSHLFNFFIINAFGLQNDVSFLLFGFSLGSKISPNGEKIVWQWGMGKKFFFFWVCVCFHNLEKNLLNCQNNVF